MFFSYRFDPAMAALLRPMGVRPDRDGVRVTDDSLVATFGFFTVEIPYGNIASAQVTGPYRWYTALGLRLSLADRGATFGTTASGGVCLTFVEPIKPIVGLWKHPGLTVTVADRQGLVDSIDERLASQ